jgi:hypothetical protein
MGILANYKKYRQVQELQKQVRSKDVAIEEYRKVQELLVKDILSLRETESTLRGNDYQEYGSAVQAISDKYNNAADWGCMQTGIIIDLRAAFILGEGVKILPAGDDKKAAEREIGWANDFLDYNDLDAEMAQEIAKEAEIEGKIALKLFPKKEKFREWPSMISVRYISWLTKKYTVVTDPQDYLDYQTLKWNPSTQTEGQTTTSTKEEELKAEEFVYKKFGGRLNKPNEAQPKIVRALTAIDKLDKATWDLRRINHLFAGPTPDFQVEDAKQVRALLDHIKDTNWRIGKAIVHTGTFSMIGPDASGIANLIEEITLWSKIISGITGIPIHYLGFLDLLKNRATGENTRELIMAVTEKERKIWIGAYEELITKAMQMYNDGPNKQASKGKKLDPEKVKVTIPHMTQEQFDRISTVYIPAAAAGIISKESVAAMIPGIDMEEEAARKEKSDKEKDEIAKREFNLLKAQATQGGGGEEEEEEGQ